MRRVQLWILKAALVAYVVFLQIGFSMPASLLSWASIVVAVLALVGAIKNRRWTTLPVTVLAVLVIGEFALSSYYSTKIGYFSHVSVRRLLAELGPDLLACFVAVDCCYVAFRYLGKPAPRTQPD